MVEILSDTHNKILTKVIVEMIIEYIPKLEFDLFYEETSSVDDDGKLKPSQSTLCRRLYACSYGFIEGVNKWKFKCLSNKNGGIGIISNIDGVKNGRDKTLWGSKKINYSYFWGSGRGLHSYLNGNGTQTSTVNQNRNKDDIITVELNFVSNKLVFYLNDDEQGSIPVQPGPGLTYYPAIETNAIHSVFQFLGELRDQ